jgi:hypothetical protein
MPKFKIKNKVFLLRWLPEWDLKVVDAAKRFRRGELIDWKMAEACGALKGIPINLTLRILSQRLSYLMRCKYNDDFKKVHNIQCKEYNRTHVLKSIMNREEVFRSLPYEVKLKYNHKTRHNQEWTPERVKLLGVLTEKHRRGNCIDWDALLRDRASRKLPQYSKSRLRSYYWSTMVHKRPDVIKQRRKDALEYKRKNIGKYRATNTKRYNVIRKVINDMMLQKLSDVR